MSKGRRRQWASRETLSRSDLVRIILKGAFGERLKADEPLAPYTSFRIGGPAQWFLRVDTVEELKEAVNVARRARIPFRVLGRGSNVLISDQGVEGLVILNRSKRFSVRPSSEGLRLVVDSGVSLPWLAGLVLLSNLLAFRSHRLWHRLLAGLAGPLMIIGALEVPALAAWRDGLFYPGLVLMLAVSVWDLVSPPGGRVCRDCEVSPNV